MLKLDTNYGTHELFLIYIMHILDVFSWYIRCEHRRTLNSKGGKAGRGHVIDMPRSKWRLS